ncbi:DddA-like double-stranded DNA deaminase toxin [Amycolatopsis sp. cg5]|uniref:DddA-like double-stranded DNA deaminase toxin n=1 Tax=Amycolatopsis sp. cg5 TaxID=3238802 RepID=UPI003523E0AF
MSVEELVSALSRALGCLPFDTLTQAVDLLAEAQDTFARVTAGTASPESQAAAVGWHEARMALVAVSEMLQVAEDLIRDYADRLGCDLRRPTSSVVGRNEPAGLRSRATDAVRAAEFTPAQVARIHEEMPPPVANPNTVGRKTHGRWFDVDGQTDELVSGRDADAEQVDAVLRELGMRRRLSVSADVELKLAVRMRKTGTRRCTVILNNSPCGGTWSCDRLLPVLLPEGYELTVYGIDGFKKVYKGGKERWW